jgi:co-chaperonin GroES (HSP10)
MAEAPGSVINPYGTGLDVGHKTIDEMFPTIDPEFRPFGHRVLVQIRRVVAKTASGIILARETKDTEAYNNTIGKVIAMGPLAFRNRGTGEPWPEGVWSAIGDYVKVPRYGGERWTVDLDDSLEPIQLVLFADSDLHGAYTGDVTRVRSHIV